MGDDFHRLPSSPRKRGSSGVSCAPRHHKSTTLDSRFRGNDGMCAFAGMTSWNEIVTHENYDGQDPNGFPLSREWRIGIGVDKPRRESPQCFKSTSVKLNEASGMVYTPVSFLLCAESNFSTTSGA